MTWRRTAVLGLATCLLACSAQSPRRDFHGLVSGLDELSGLCLREDGQGFYGVSDAGYLVEFDGSGRILREADFSDDDLEGVCLGPAGEIWLISERKSEVLQIEAATFALKKRLKANSFPGRQSANNGFEGLAYEAVDGGTLWLLNQEPAGLARYQLRDGRLVKTEELSLDASEANDLMLLSGNRGFVVLSREDGLRLFDRQGRALGDWYELEEDDLEGLCLWPGVALYLCRDAEPSDLIALDDIKTEEQLIALLSNK